MIRIKILIYVVAMALTFKKHLKSNEAFENQFNANIFQLTYALLLRKMKLKLAHFLFMKFITLINGQNIFCKNANAKVILNGFLKRKSFWKQDLES